MAVIPTSACDLFDNIFFFVVQNNPDKAREIGAKYVFQISGEGGGNWTVDLASEKPAITQGVGENAQCTIEVAHEDFMAMLKNPAMGMQLFFQGKLKVKGDPMLATKLQKLFSLA